MKIHTLAFLILLTCGLVPDCLGLADAEHRLVGELKQWHGVTVELGGPAASETGSPNPFMDYRFNVSFTGPSNQTLVVPGYFATDGQGGDSGNVWRAHLNPDEVGPWSYTISFREGTEVAVDLSPAAGSAVSAYDGLSGTFTVLASDKVAPDFRAPERGMLVNRENHYLTFANGRPFVYAGPGIPENLLGYRGFTNTTEGVGHEFVVHEAHWNPGDPDWGSQDGRRLIGALNYIAGQGGNALYLMSNTIGGDGKDVFMHTNSSSSKDEYDILKLDQWDLALSHAQALGIFLHLHLAEHEVPNKEYYGASLSALRRLYFRMLVARFGHYNGLKWNLMEETRWTPAEHQEQAAYIKAIDPYDHPLTYQVGGAGVSFTTYQNHYGDPNFDNGSFQGSASNAAMFNTVQQYRQESAAGGYPWTITWDEPQKIENDNSDFANGYPHGRRNKMWPAFMAGAAGFQWYIQKDGGGHGFDQRIEDFTIMQQALNWCQYARDFLEALPLLEMSSDMSGVSVGQGEAYVLRKPGTVYAVYSDTVGTGINLDMSGESGLWDVFWFDPRQGGYYTGSTLTVSAGASNVDLGTAPHDDDMDWAILLTPVVNPRILFVIGGEGTAGGPECGGALGTQVDCKSEHRASLFNTSTAGGNHGWSELAALLSGNGFLLDEIEEGPWDAPAPVPFAAMDLSQYAAIVLGSNNVASYPTADIDAIETYVRGGGSLMFISDANFGPNSTAAMISDQQFMDRFGLTMNRDRGTYTLSRATDYSPAGMTHPILAGVDDFDGEGVSPITVQSTLPPGANFEVLAYAEVLRNPAGQDVAPTVIDGALVAGTVDAGRVVGFFDRNSFFNINGAGSYLQKLDNATLALNLFQWMTAGSGLNIPPMVEAGADRELVVPANSVLLSGSVTDPDSPSVSHTWSGPAGVSFGNASALATTATFPGAGSWILTLTADDGVNPPVEDALEVSVLTSRGLPAQGFVETGGVVSMEAEDGLLGANWLVREDASYAGVNASGGQFIEIQSSLNRLVQQVTESNPDNICSYPFTISTDGDYRLWVRFQTTSDQDDSFFWRLDGGTWTIQNDVTGLGLWVEIDLPEGASFSGSHDLEITYRENGTFLDKFVVQLASVAPPSGDGPSSGTPAGISTYEDIRAGMGLPDTPETDPLADLNKNGMVNVLEYLMGGGLSADPGAAPGLELVMPSGPGENALLRYRQQAGMGDYYLQPWYSNDLELWQRLNLLAEDITVTQLSDRLDEIEIEFQIPLDTVFVRLSGENVE